MKNEAYSISATDIEIWAKIGVHPEESFIENCFLVNVQVNAAKPYEKDHYLNYELILDVVKLVFSRPQKVLEDICIEIIDELRLKFSQPIQSISCDIRKVKPAMEGLRVGYLNVAITKNFDS